MPDVSRIKLEKRSIVDRHAQPDDASGLMQSSTTLVPLALLWGGVEASAEISLALTGALVPLLVLFHLRCFVMLHECGHGSLFRTRGLNQGMGFVYGVITGMPQFVWSQHHHFHHSTNGNWARYRGPLGVITTDEFAAMTPAQQRRYQRQRSLWLAPLAGFLYLIVNPRVNWFKGSCAFLGHVARGGSAASFRTRYWETREQYWHMFANNVVLLPVLALLALGIEPLLFLAMYCTSTALAGGVGIVLFTVQHNFEHSYASGDEGWCYDRAAIDGTSFLVLPAWLNWFTANIAYHHVHHLSARIPNHRLAACHDENAQLFENVTRVRLGQIPHSLGFILWDTRAQRLVSVAEHRSAQAPAAAA